MIRHFRGVSKKELKMPSPLLNILMVEIGKLLREKREKILSIPYPRYVSVFVYKLKNNC